MFYGFLAAWLIVLVYIVTLVRRSGRLRKELENVKQLFEDKQAAPKIR
jgi:CcmD family protein